MKGKTLPSIKVSEQHLDNMKSAIDKFNETSLIVLSLQEFRRMSYNLFSQMILQDLKIPIELLRK